MNSVESKCPFRKREYILPDLTLNDSDDSCQECSIKSRKMLGEGAWPVFFKAPVTQRGSRFQLRCSRAARAALRAKQHSQLTSSRAARPGTEVTLTDAYLRLHTNGVVARDLCLISAEQFLFVMGADHLRSAFAHLANPRQWSRAPCNLKGSGAESGSRAYRGLKPLAGFETCNFCLFYVFPGLMTNMELPGRCVLLAALLMSVPHPVRSGQYVNYSPSRCEQNKLSGC